MPDKYKKYLFLVPAGLLFLYTSARAYKLSFTIDEATSFMDYCQGSYYSILHPAILEANNHMLNSVLMKFFSSWLPLSEFTLRIQSLAGHIMFLLFTWLLLRDVKDIWQKLALYLILNLSPFMLDFFSLARGYGLAWGLMSGSLWYLKRLFETKAHKAANIGLCFLFGAVAVLANFTIMDYYIPLLIFYIFYIVFCVLQYRLKIFWQGWFWAGLLMVIIISWPLLRFSVDALYALKNSGALFWGGTTGFWSDTVTSIIEISGYDLVYPAYVYSCIKMLVIIAVIGCITYAFSGMSVKERKSAGNTALIIGISARNKPGYNFFLVLLFIFFLVVVGIIAQFYLLGTLYIFERYGYFILIIFTLLCVFFLASLKSTKVSKAITFLLLGFSLFHFARAFNFSHVNDWKMNADNKQMMQDFGEIQDKEPYKSKAEITLQAPWEYVSAINFYKKLYGYNRLKFIERNKDINYHSDFYYYFDTSMSRFKNQPVEIIKSYPESHTIFLKNINIKTSRLLYHKIINMYDTLKASPVNPDSNEIAAIENIKCIKVHKTKYAPTAVFDLRKCNCASGINVKAVAKLYFPDGKKSGDLAIAVFSKDGKVLEWHSYKFDKDQQTAKGWISIPYEVDFPAISENAGELKVFVWNTGDSDIYVADMAAEVKDL